MIKIYKRIVKAACDACGKDLSTEDQKNSDGTPSGVHYGVLANHYGYGSDLDGIDDPNSKLDLCEDCYRKCFAALGIPRGIHASDWNLRTVGDHRLVDTGEPFNSDNKDHTGRELYYVRGWRCILCGWEDFDHGAAHPKHTCESKEKVDKLAEDKCDFCNQNRPEYNHQPFYAERQDAWIHTQINYKQDTDEVCAVNALRIELMQKGGSNG